MFKGIIMDIKSNYIIVSKEGGEFVKLAKKNNLKVGDIIYFFKEDIYLEKNTYNRNSYVKWFISMGSAAALIIIFLNPLLKLFSPTTSKIYAVVSLDVNPSIELSLDDEGFIIEATGINDQGNMLNIDDIKGLTFENGVSILNEQLKTQNYLINNNSLLVGFSFLNDENIEYEKRIQDTVKDTFTNIEVAYMKGTPENITNAKQQGVSLGKYEAILKLQEDGLDDALENLTTQELLNLLKSNNGNVFLSKDKLEDIKDELDDRLDDDSDTEDDDSDNNDDSDDDNDLDDSDND